MTHDISKNNFTGRKLVGWHNRSKCSDACRRNSSHVLFSIHSTDSILSERGTIWQLTYRKWSDWQFHKKLFLGSWIKRRTHLPKLFNLKRNLEQKLLSKVKNNGKAPSFFENRHFSFFNWKIFDFLRSVFFFIWFLPVIWCRVSCFVSSIVSPLAATHTRSLYKLFQME